MHQPPLHNVHMLIVQPPLRGWVDQGEQDQGVSFKGPAAALAAAADGSAVVDGSPDLETAEIGPKSHMVSALRRDSFQNIGQRRRSSASNQPTANIRRGTPSTFPVSVLRRIALTYL